MHLPRPFFPVCLFLPGLALLPVACRPAGKPGAGPPPVPQVTVALPLARKVVEQDEFTGRLVAPETVEVRSRVSGFIDEIHFKEGSEVKEGDMLFSIDPRPYQATLDRVTAELGIARTQADLAKLEAANATQLRDNRAISSEETERRLKAAAGAEGAVRAAEAMLKTAQLDLEFTRVKSPVTGRISNARVTRGNLVTGGTREATILTTVVSLDPIYCYIDVDERSALKYRELHKAGSRTSALFDRIPARMGLANQSGYPHAGFIDFVDNQLDPATGTIRARGVFENKDRLMSPGFFARMQIPGSGEYEAVLIPDEAVGDDQGHSFVWVVDAQDKAAYRAVKLGPLTDGLRTVREGLTPQDRVVINGMMAVRAGIQVAPQMASAPAGKP